MGSNSHTPPEVVQFAEVARRYCAWVDTKAQVPIDLVPIRRLLAELQLGAIGLPDLDCGDHDEIHEPSPEIKELVLHRVSTVPFRYYWVTFNPLKENETPVCGDLADDLDDIWLDLWTGLRLFDSGHALEANFHWRLLYNSHWGQHILTAQRAIYAFLTK